MAAHFKKNKTIKCSGYLCVLLFQSDVPTGKNGSLRGVTSLSECGTCFQVPPGRSAFPWVKDMAWHSESGRQFEVPLRERHAGWGWERTTIDSDVQ